MDCHNNNPSCYCNVTGAIMRYNNQQDKQLKLHLDPDDKDPITLQPFTYDCDYIWLKPCHHAFVNNPQTVQFLSTPNAKCPCCREFITEIMDKKNQPLIITDNQQPGLSPHSSERIDLNELRQLQALHDTLYHNTSYDTELHPSIPQHHHHPSIPQQHHPSIPQQYRPSIPQQHQDYDNGHFPNVNYMRAHSHHPNLIQLRKHSRHPHLYDDIADWHYYYHVHPGIDHHNFFYAWYEYVEWKKRTTTVIHQNKKKSHGQNKKKSHTKNKKRPAACCIS